MSGRLWWSATWCKDLLVSYTIVYVCSFVDCTIAASEPRQQCCSTDLGSGMFAWAVYSWWASCSKERSQAYLSVANSAKPVQVKIGFIGAGQINFGAFEGQKAEVGTALETHCSQSNPSVKEGLSWVVEVMCWYCISKVWWTLLKMDSNCNALWQSVLIGLIGLADLRHEEGMMLQAEQ